MKSLKNEKTLKQIKIDSLLRINIQPSNSCPIIDLLSYNHKNNAMLYEIDFDTKLLNIENYQLINITDKLKLWSTDILDLACETIDNVEDNDEREEINILINDLKQCINDDKTHYLSIFDEQLKHFVEQWTFIQLDYDSIDNKVISAKNRIDNIRSKENYLESDDDNYDAEIDTHNQELDNAQYNLSVLEGDLEQLKSDFYYDIETPLKSLLNELTAILEFTRMNNGSIRTLTTELKHYVIPHLSSDYDLTQPIEYLRSLETGASDEISLGLVDVLHNEDSINKITFYLKEHQIINELQVKLINQIGDINCLVDILKEQGYKIIRYYDDYKTYIEAHDSFTEINLRH